MKTLHIVYILNDVYWLPALVSAISALLHLENGELVFHFIEDGVTIEHKDIIKKRLTTRFSCVKFHVPKADLLGEMPDWHGSSLVWTRCYLDQLLTDVNDWTCICDGDTLWFKNPMLLLDEVGNLSEEVIIAGSHKNSEDKGWSIPRFAEKGLDLPVDDTFCLGFAMLHIGRMRRFDVLGKVRDFIEKYGVPKFLEQDIFNWIFRNNKAILSKQWGAFSHNGNLIDSLSDSVGLIHYVCDLPWQQGLRCGLTDAKKMWWFLADELSGIAKLDVRYKKRIAYYLMKLFASILPRICGGYLLRYLSGDFVPMSVKRRKITWRENWRRLYA